MSISNFADSPSPYSALVYHCLALTTSVAGDDESLVTYKKLNLVAHVTLDVFSDLTYRLTILTGEHSEFTVKSTSIAAIFIKILRILGGDCDENDIISDVGAKIIGALSMKSTWEILDEDIGLSCDMVFRFDNRIKFVCLHENAGLSAVNCRTQMVKVLDLDIPSEADRMRIAVKISEGNTTFIVRFGNKHIIKASNPTECAEILVNRVLKLDAERSKVIRSPKNWFNDVNGYLGKYYKGNISFDLIGDDEI